MRENHRSQMEKNKTNAKRNTTEGPSTSMSSSDVQSSAADEPEQESAAPQTHRRNKSISAAHPAIYLNTRSHKLLRRAVRIWKMPIPIMNFTGSLKPKPKNFQERLKRVEMLRNRSEDSKSPKPMTRSVRDQQLCSSGTDSSPSPSSTSLQSHRNLRTRTVHVHRSRRYKKQLQLYRMLSNNKRRRQSHEKPNRLEGHSSPAASSCVKGSSENQDDQRDSPSSQSPSVIRAPPRKTSRRLWRRQLDSSSSDNSPMTTNPVNSIRLDTPEYHRQKPGKPDKKCQNRRISFSDVSSELAEFDCLDNNSNLSKEASAPAQKNINNQDSPDLKPDDQTNEKSTEKSLKITGTNVEQHQHELDSEASLVSQLKIFKEELKQCEDAIDTKQQKLSQEPFKIKNPSSTTSRNTQSNTDALQKPDTPRPKSCVKWKNVLMQKALCSFTFPYENQDLTHKSRCRFTLEDSPTPAGRSDTDRPDMTPECPEKPDEDHIKNEAAGDAFIPN